MSKKDNLMQASDCVREALIALERAGNLLFDIDEVDLVVEELGAAHGVIQYAHMMLLTEVEVLNKDEAAIAEVEG